MSDVLQRLKLFHDVNKYIVQVCLLGLLLRSIKNKVLKKSVLPLPLVDLGIIDENSLAKILFLELKKS
jgi:hypothetical protein